MKIVTGHLSLVTAFMFLSTIALLTPIKDSLAALRYSQPSPEVAPVISADPGDPVLFDQVDFHSSKDVGEAMQSMRVFQNRACLIVPLGDDYDNKISGTDFISARTTEFMLMLADRDLSVDRGSMQSTLDSPGILATKDLVVTFLTGRPLILSGQVVPIEPRAGAIAAIEWKEGKPEQTFARECWLQGFRAAAGRSTVSFGRRFPS